MIVARPPENAPPGYMTAGTIVRLQAMFGLEEGGWRYDAACIGAATEIFFPDTTDKEDEELAKNICRSCEVVNQCLEFALSTNQNYGVWGSMNDVERRSFRRRRRLAAAHNATPPKMPKSVPEPGYRQRISAELREERLLKANLLYSQRHEARLERERLQLARS